MHFLPQRSLALPLAALVLTLAVGARGGDVPDRWWAPGEGRVLPAVLDYENANGTLRTLTVGGPLKTAGHPFFEPLGKDGRACVTCHQPADAMGLSVESARRQWERTKGKD
ncbi:MAG: hypothetical protein B7Y31_09285, partial [Novosphingobium sp. 16-62-11]